MITVRMGDIFESGAQTLVNTVNCVGIMGKGVALEFKKRFPDMFEKYAQRCKNQQVKLGRPYVYRRLMPPWILNFPTKDHWRSVSRLQDIVEGLRYLAAHYREWGITSLALPPLGCGQGQLEWRVVGPTLYRHLKTLDIPVELFAPFGTPHEELRPAFLEPPAPKTTAPTPESEPETPKYRILPAWVALVEILRGIENERYHRPIGRTTFQKIAYFATESAIPTGLQYGRGSYGPFSPELKRHIAALVNNGLIREEQKGRMFAVRVGPTFADARRAYATQIEEWRGTIEKIIDLFMRMDTNQAEVAASVLFAAMELHHQSKTKAKEADILQQVMTWKQRRRPPLDSKEVALAVRKLNLLRWINAEVSPEIPVSEEEFLHA